MTDRHHVAIVGSGSPATPICQSLASLAPRGGTLIEVTVFARDLDAVGAIVHDCRSPGSTRGPGTPRHGC
ncbi:hypothetical protein Cs7R123_46090 [Catellatospora sp. TT07R-123]|uniref:hypothetical protein n=1 Tax=Catellatospora sp. TT07R-123 TaxID=2733863 RepID=UPI001B114C04|nr:hypothetical protein [Catellatospora sp. TT07R-123]GHJ47267.1 hypothetical protein Cs7R123_46090 [Catellatospora sp. TT07R-123]